MVKGDGGNVSKLREISIIVGCAVRTKIPASKNFHGAHGALHWTTFLTYWHWVCPGLIFHSYALLYYQIILVGVE